MVDDSQIEFIVSTLSRTLAYERHRLAVGMAVREHLHEQLENGVVIDHYRSGWLRESVRSMLILLDQIGTDFNREHPDDKCSSSDMMDIAQSVVASLQGYINDPDD